MHGGKKNLAWLLVILLVGLGLRASLLFWGLPSETMDVNSYHPDECGVLIAIQNMHPEKGDFDTKTYYWGTLYFYITAVALKFGQILGWIHLVPGKDFYLKHLHEMDKMYIVGRLISIAASMLSVFLMYLVGRRFLGNKEGLLCAGLLSVMPNYVLRSSLMLPEATGVCLLLFALWSLGGLDSKKGLRHLVYSGIFLGLAAATKYHFALTFIFFAPLIFYWARSGLLPTALPKTFLLFFLAAIAGFAIVSPYTIINIDKLIYWLRNFGHYMGGSHWIIVGEYGSSLLCVLNMFLFGGAAFFALAAWAVVLSILRRETKSRILAVVPLFFLLLLSVSKTRLCYYFLPALPFSCLLMVHSFSCRSRVNLYPVRKFLSNGVYVPGIVIALSLLQSLSFVEVSLQKDTRTQASEYLIQNVREGSSIGVTHNKYNYTPPILHDAVSYFDVRVFGRNFTGYDLDKLKRSMPERFVLSEFEFREFDVHPERFPTQKEFIDFVRGNYKLEKRFRKSPSILGLKLPRLMPPWDERNYYPTVDIYKL